MKKIGTWLLNHLGLVLGILTFTITFAVIGIVMLNSHNSYLAYEKRYDEIDLDVRSNSPASPGYIEFNDQFKSKYKNKLSLAAEDLTVTTSQEEYLNDDYIDLTEKGGAISVKLSLEEKSFVDIDFEVATEYVEEAITEEEEDEFGIKDLISNVQFAINGELMEEKGVNLIDEGFHHLIMARFALPKGEVNVEIKSISGKTALMPQLKTITFFSSAVLSISEEAAE